MKNLISALILILVLACDKPIIKYSLYSNGNLVFEILPKDILFYDTTQSRGYVEIQKIRLRNGFYKKDSLLLVYPLDIICFIGGKKYFWAEHFFKAQSEPRLYVNFRFDPNCGNSWKVNEGGPVRPFKGDTVILYTNNECNSIEFFHRKKRIQQNIKLFEKEKYFISYTDTARLAHQILLDPYYLNTIKDNGILIK